jgi:hypothetical protein
MKNVPVRLGLSLAAALAILPAPALAKEDNLAKRAQDIAEQANDVQAQAGALANDAANADAARDADTTAARRDGDPDGNAANDRDDDHDGFPWGLLGLLGLAGLLGLKRNDRDPRRDPHVYTTGGDNPRV